MARASAPGPAPSAGLADVGAALPASRSARRRRAQVTPAPVVAGHHRRDRQRRSTRWIAAAGCGRCWPWPPTPGPRPPACCWRPCATWTPRSARRRPGSWPRAGRPTRSRTIERWVATGSAAERAAGLEALRLRPSLSASRPRGGAAGAGRQRGRACGWRRWRSWPAIPTRRSAPRVAFLLDDPAPAVRLQAVRLLGLAGDRRAVLSLLGRLEDPDRQVQREAVAVLGRLGDARAAGALLRLLEEGPAELRLPVVDAVAALRLADAVPALARLAARRPRDPLARRAQRALGEIGSAPARAALMALLDGSPLAPELEEALARHAGSLENELLAALAPGDPRAAAAAVVLGRAPAPARRSGAAAAGVAGRSRHAGRAARAGRAGRSRRQRDAGGGRGAALGAAAPAGAGGDAGAGRSPHGAGGPRADRRSRSRRARPGPALAVRLTPRPVPRQRRWRGCCPALDDPAPEVRRQAVAAVRQLHPPGAVAALLAAWPRLPGLEAPVGRGAGRARLGAGRPGPGHRWRGTDRRPRGSPPCRAWSRRWPPPGPPARAPGEPTSIALVAVAGARGGRGRAGRRPRWPAPAPTSWTPRQRCWRRPCAAAWESSRARPCERGCALLLVRRPALAAAAAGGAAGCPARTPRCRRPPPGRWLAATAIAGVRAALERARDAAPPGGGRQRPRGPGRRRARSPRRRAGPACSWQRPDGAARRPVALAGGRGGGLAVWVRGGPLGQVTPALAGRFTRLADRPPRAAAAAAPAPGRPPRAGRRPSGSGCPAAARASAAARPWAWTPITRRVRRGQPLGQQATDHPGQHVAAAGGAQRRIGRGVDEGGAVGRG